MIDCTSSVKVIRKNAGFDISWDNGTTAWFHAYWLRENCHCPKCFHPSAWERLVDMLAIPHTIQPSAVEATADGLSLTWPAHDAPCDGTYFSWEWLLAHRTETDARLARKKKRTSWAAQDLDIAQLSIDYEAVMNTDAGLLNLLEHIDDVGVAITRNMPDAADAVTSLANRIAFIEESHFGRSFEVESKPNPENLAYTAHALAPHNDLPSRSHIPGVQFLHCRVNNADGGESILVDSIRVANKLRDDYPEYFSFLSTHPVQFNSISDSWHIINRGTVIQLDEDGDIIGTRMHPALLGPVDIEPEKMDLFYRAHRAMLEICVSPEMQFTFKLGPGQCQIFDNYRIMHARKSFDPNSGNRHLHGCYVTRDDLQSKLEVLRRKGADFRQI